MDARQYFDELCQSIPSTVKGSMFGWPCYKIGKKPFAFFDRNHENGAAFKLPGDAGREALALDGAEIFNPGEYPMKNWVLLPYSQFEHWERFAHWAVEMIKLELDSPKKKSNGKQI